MFASFPKEIEALMAWKWSDFEPYYQELAAQSLNAANVEAWLAEWSRLAGALSEIEFRLQVGTTVDTNDEAVKARYSAFLDEIYPQAKAADQTLKQKLLDSGLEPQGFEMPLKNMRAEAALFRQENLPLLGQELKLSTRYDEIVGAQTVEWEGEEVTLPQLQPVYQDPDRARRERAWRLALDRWLEDREAINSLWGELLNLRRQLAQNAELPDYREYRWRQLRRFDYSPQDCVRFQAAIEAVVVPAAQRLYEKRRRQLGLDTLRPWDLEVDPLGRAPLQPFENVAELEDKCAAIFHQVDLQLGEYFETMRREGLLDLDNRKGKAPGGYCMPYYFSRRPFIFANCVGVHDDVQTMLHEGGHAFHTFESADLPYFHQMDPPMEFAEVASMGMELLASPYLTAEHSGFYSAGEAARARIEFLERAIQFWPYMAVVDAFQHWVYGNPGSASEPENCDARWAELWERFMPGVDWSGLETGLSTGWQRKQHIHQVPFYYVEYGLAQLGAVQVWRNALDDQSGAVRAYRKALAKGGMLPLPQLFALAGARFAFDEQILRQAVGLMEGTIAALEDEGE